MAYRVPTFPLLVNIWKAAPFNPALPDLPNVHAQLHVEPYQTVFNTSIGITFPALTALIYLPKLTDVRPQWIQLPPSVIECPAGSHRFYSCINVDDVAKGFANEFRCVLAFAQNVAGFPTWPVPIP